MLYSLSLGATRGLQDHNKVVHVNIAGFLIKLSPNRPYASNSFFRLKTSKVAIVKTKSATGIALSFSFISFSFVTMILELLGLKKPAF